MDTNFTIVSAYFPPNLSTSVFGNTISQLITFLENTPNVLLCGDFNARSTIWGDSVSLPKGSTLEAIIFSSGFRSLNDGSPTFHRYVDTNIQSSVLDLSFTNSSTHFTWSTIDTHISNSHHKPIMIISNQIMPPKKTSFLNKQLLIENLSKVTFSPNLDEFQDVIMNEIKKSTVKAMTRTPKAWWNVNLFPFFTKMTEV